MTGENQPTGNQVRARILDDAGDVGEGWFEFIDPSPDTITYTARHRPLPGILAARINHDRIRLLGDLRAMLTGAVFVMPNFVSCELEADARRIEEAFK